MTTLTVFHGRRRERRRERETQEPKEDGESEKVRELLKEKAFSGYYPDLLSERDSQDLFLSDRGNLLPLLPRLSGGKKSKRPHTYPYEGIGLNTEDMALQRGMYVGDD